MVGEARLNLPAVILGAVVADGDANAAHSGRFGGPPMPPDASRASPPEHRRGKADTLPAAT